ncbi:hypothetical protein [Effusibacillus pohliae]|uniref:hypothetical protein n=1 Tax=Effusibacillus pohliae TaxID=232270 RepID=UPI000375302E|nr:hypothetical protein [Effusibacillus pohliae]
MEKIISTIDEGLSVRGFEVGDVEKRGWSLLVELCVLKNPVCSMYPEVGNSLRGLNSLIQCCQTFLIKKLNNRLGFVILSILLPLTLFGGE